MNKKNKWINPEGSIMYYYVFDILDNKGSGVMASVNYREPDNSGYKQGLSYYEIRGNVDLHYTVGEYSDNRLVVEDEKILNELNKLPIKRDVIKWEFTGQKTMKGDLSEI